MEVLSATVPLMRPPEKPVSTSKLHASTTSSDHPSATLVGEIYLFYKSNSWKFSDPEKKPKQGKNKGKGRKPKAVKSTQKGKIRLPPDQLIDDEYGAFLKNEDDDSEWNPFPETNDPSEDESNTKPAASTDQSATRGRFLSLFTSHTVN